MFFVLFPESALMLFTQFSTESIGRSITLLEIMPSFAIFVLAITGNPLHCASIRTTLKP